MTSLGNSHIASCSFGGQGRIVLHNWKTGEAIKNTISGNAGYHSLIQVFDK